jgi:BMFP domain-containing protein YqiC
MTQQLEYVTREILKEELSASEQRLEVKIAGVDKKIDGVEQRLDTKIGNVEKRLEAKIVGLDGKIDTTAQSLKDYTDSRFNKLDMTIKTMDAKMTRYFEGIGSMLESLTGTSAATRDRLDNHEQRITALEGRRG